MLIHNQTINPCKCGSKDIPVLDSDDMIPSWGVKCYDCQQFQYNDWNSAESAVGKWNKENPLEGNSKPFNGNR
jgi:hypothetical protein